MKKFIALTICVFLAVTAFMFVGCNDKPVIGIVKFGNHASLNNCYEGLLQGLEEGGIDLSAYSIKLHDSDFTPSVSAQQSKALVDSGAKIILAIATPSAVAAANAARTSKTPVVYTAVSDPDGVSLTGLDYVTGSSDVLNFTKQLEMIKAFVPGVKNIGVLSNINESNSVYQVNLLKKAAKAFDFNIIVESFNEARELSVAGEALIATPELHAITNLTDNSVMTYLPTLNKIIKDRNLNIPVFGSEVEQLDMGCLATESIDYKELGRLTGLMAAKILKGEKTAGDIEFIRVEETFSFYNSTVLRQFGLELPEAYADIPDVAVAD